ncbi:oxidoreductase [Ostreococcus tauri]|uniref:Oxidoreductase n=1 Tax=Ostreococcus tauri TaxID=70448 RepID=A0A1Y5HZB8_OSTTA|nr:oxidoreductase [Ostreococcus tauri]
MASVSSGFSLITGATDGIGRHTARRLVECGKSVVAHGRDDAKVDDVMRELEALAAQKGSGAMVRGVVSDLATVSGARALAGLVRETVESGGGLEALYNNAGVFMKGGYVETADGREITFAVNVVAPYVLTGLLMGDLVKRARESGRKSSVLNVASISASPRIDFENINAEKMFSAHGSYSLSKACMKAFSYELFDRLAAGKLCNGDATVDNLNVFSCDPGTVNTKMLLAGWGRCGIEIFEANDQFDIMVSDIEKNSVDFNGCYFVGAAPMKRSSAPGDADQARLWALLERETKLVYV